jgi:hypothetical protein
MSASIPTAMNSVLTNAMANTNSAMKSVGTVMNTIALNTTTTNSSTSSIRPWIMIMLVVGLAIGGIYIFKQYSGSKQSVFPEPVMPAPAMPAQMQELPAPEPAANTVPQGQTWCFVGEDVQGRWCLQVPSKHACDSNRSFPSEEDCKLVPASPMPLGVATRGDSLMQPLGPIPVMSNTY